MARQFKRVSLAIFLTVALTAQADDDDTTQVDEGKWYISQLASYTDDDADRRLDDSIGGGEFRLGWRWNDRFALEGLLGYHRIDGWPEWPVVQQRQHQDFLELGMNVITSFNPKGNFSPYLIAGAGYLDTETELGTSDNGPTGSAGVGMKVRFGDSPWSLRAEWRMRHAFGGDNSYTDQLSSVGVRYSFGDSGSDYTVLAAVPETNAAVPQDSDGDGIVDSRDACPNSPPGTPVNVAGCARDVDQDGVADDQDRCAGTAAGIKVNRDGCQAIELNNVYFAIESAVLNDYAKRALDASASVLASNAEARVEVGGHTDSSGPEDYNMKLSQRRAEAVRQYLVQAGVDLSRLTVRGYGESQPISSNETVLGRSDNRRTELTLLDR